MVDTIEDRVDLSPGERSALFGHMLRLVREPEDKAERAGLQKLWPEHPDPHHESLIRHAGDVFDCFQMLPGPSREAITECVEDMVAGMSRFPAPAGHSEPVEACRDLETLEAYCHHVAGTVGLLLSHLFAGELESSWLTPIRAEDGRRFGLGLQLTNVLKDYRGDRERGITYIPGIWIENGGALSAEGKRILVGRALEHLNAAHRYILALPPHRTDMRVFCLWAAYLALATLRLVARRSETDEPAKVSRDELWAILEKTRDLAGDDAALTELHTRSRGEVEVALPA
jgi:farnesyl-diphosphate farnesyltransferase